MNVMINIKLYFPLFPILVPLFEIILFSFTGRQHPKYLAYMGE